MSNEEIKNLIKELLQKTKVTIEEVGLFKDDKHGTWFQVKTGEAHFFTERDGEALRALNHLVKRIVEGKTASTSDSSSRTGVQFLIDVNDFQRKKIENVRTIAHMMSERARYFKSNIEIDPMPPFERRIVHEFLADAADLATESIGLGPSRRVVIKYVEKS